MADLKLTVVDQSGAVIAVMPWGGIDRPYGFDLFRDGARETYRILEWDRSGKRAVVERVK